MPNIPRLKRLPTGPQPPADASPAGYNRASARAPGLQAVTDAINQKYDATEKTYADLVTRMPRASDGSWVIDFFQEAVRKFPTYQPLYFTRMNYLLPQWGGSFEAVGKFVNARRLLAEKRSMSGSTRISCARSTAISSRPRELAGRA